MTISVAVPERGRESRSLDLGGHILLEFALSKKPSVPKKRVVNPMRACLSLQMVAQPYHSQAQHVLSQMLIASSSFPVKILETYHCQKQYGRLGEKLAFMLGVPESQMFFGLMRRSA